MPNKIILKKSAVASKIPTVSDLDYGELALNYADGKLYYKNSNNAIDEFRSSAATVSGVSSVGGATGAISAQQLLDFIKQVDGSGSGLDADTLDGINSSSFATLTGTQTLTNKTIAAGSNTISGLTNSNLSGSAGITNANLANSSITVGTTAIALGSSSTTLAGLTSVTSTSFVGALTGNASTATTLVTARTISLTGDVTYTSGTFDGSANVTGTATLASVGTAGTYTKVTTDAKGRVTSGTTLATSDIPSLDASKITSGTIDAARLPSYVDDVIEGANLAAFPVTGETGKIYVALDTNKTYRWSGSAYVYITSGAVDSVAGKTGVVTLVKGDVGLGNVDNTADSTKSVSSAATLTTARTIGGVSFNGSANIDLPGVNTTGNQNTSGTASNVTGTVAVANGGTGATTAQNARTNLGATTLGSNIFTIVNPSAITFPRFNADNTISSLSAADFRTAIGVGGGSSGTVTSVGLSLPSIFTVTNSPVTTSGTLTATLASQTANTFLASPNGASGVPTFRAIVGADIPTLNQSTTGNAGTATTWQNARTLTIGNTGKSVDGSSNVAWSLSEIGAYAATNPSGYTNNTGTVTSVSGTGTVSGLTLSGTVTTSGNITLSGTLAVSASNFSSQTANTVLAAPNGSAGVPTFRALVAADIPTLNQNTTGNAGTATTLQTARNINGVSFNGSASITIEDNTKLPLAGGTMSGAIAMGANKITGLGTPTASTDAANKAYVDTLVASGIHFHQPVRVSTTSSFTSAIAYNNGSNGVNATITKTTPFAALSVDGVTLAVGNRVLVKDASTSAWNGIYTVTNIGSASVAWVLTRAADANTYEVSSPNGLSEGSTVFVQAGITNAGNTYTVSTVGVITFGTTNINYAQVSSAQIYSAGTGLLLDGTQFNNTGVLSVNSLTGAITATNLLDAIKTVDGSGSGLDADLLDGQTSSYYLDYTNLTNKPTIPTVPTNVSAFTNDANYATQTFVNTATSTKQDTLVSATNIKTINGNSILGSGNITISGSGGATYTTSVVDVSSVATLRLSGSDASTDDVSFVGGTGITVERIDASTINISSQSPVTTDFIDLTDTALSTIDSFDKTVYRTAKYLIQAVNGSDVHCTEVLITHNNTDVLITEYATMFSGSSLMTISASIDTTTVYLEATATNNDTEIDFVRTTVSRVSAAPPSGDLEGDLMLQSGTEDLMTGTGTVDLDV
jgi:hypothetical protein